MSKLLKHTETRVVGVSFKNEDGTSRQEILSESYEGESVSLDYYEYNGEPAYAVIDFLGNQIGNLSRELAAVIYSKYNDCYYDASILRITGGDDTKYLGCVISLDIYDEAPEDVSDNIAVDSTPVSSSIPNSETAPIENNPHAKKLPSPKMRKFYSILFIVGGILLLLIGLLLLLAVPLGGIIAIVFAIICFFIGNGYRKS